MIVCLFGKYIIRCHNCDNSLDVECSLASFVTVCPFLDQKFSLLVSLPWLLLIYEKLFVVSLTRYNLTYFFLKFSNSSVRSVYFNTYRYLKFNTPPKDSSSFLFVVGAIFSIFSVKSIGLVIYFTLKWNNLIMIFYYFCLRIFFFHLLSFQRFLIYSRRCRFSFFNSFSLVAPMHISSW